MKLIVLFIVLIQSFSIFSQEETSVLFIGNSFTYTYSMPFKFKEIAESFGRETYVDTVIKGGKNLEFHSNQANTYNKIRSRKWDYVVIQGYSREFTNSSDVVDVTTLPFARKIIDSIRANHSCTKILFFETWGYKNGVKESPLLSDYSLMQAAIEKEYLRFADLFSESIAPVGSVWEKVREKYPSFNLYNEDLYHPSREGSYLAACTFYASIFRVSPVNTTSKSLLSKEVRNSIELMAAQVVLNDFDKWRLTPKRPDLEVGYDVILQNNKLELENRAENFDSISWNFGDGTTSKEISPKHKYKKKGSYTIVQNISNLCESKSLVREIKVKRNR